MNDEINTLKSEITRLNRIITVLLDRIIAAEQENLVLKNENALRNSIYTHADSEMGMINDFNTHPAFEKGIKENNDTAPVFDKHIKNSNDTDADFYKGIKKDNDTHANFGKGIINDFNTHAKTGNASAKSLGSAAATVRAAIEINNDNVVKLSKALQQFFPHTRQRNAISTIAHELLYLHNATHATSKELRKEAGLSKPGFAKHLPKLKRRGLVVYVPPKKYKLTALSRSIIADAFE
jgi:hypothetical protein